MRLTDGDAVAAALARYVRDFVPGPAHGVAVIRSRADDGALIGVYGKPGRGGGGEVQLALYEALLARARVDVVGTAACSRGTAWAVVVWAGRLVHPLTRLLTDLLDRRVVGPGAWRNRADRRLADQRVRDWCDWWHLLSG
jgi:hypothetical protein